jgi:tetratricopeptide (TPR) repeat protein
MAEDESDWETVTSEVNLARHSGVFRPHLLVVKGRAEEKNQDYASAESSYRQVLDLSPHNWHALNGLGVVLKRQGRFDEAKEHYQAALAIFPGASVVWNNLGALYKSMGDSGRGNSGLTDESRKFYQMAETEYRKVLGHVPRDAGANNNLGNLYKARMQPDSAAAYYELALESNPELAQAHNNLADLYRQKRQYQKAISHYKTAADLIHTEPRIFWGLAQSLEAAGDVTGALEAYKTTISLKEDFAQVHFSMGNLLYDLGRFEQALQHFRRFIELWSGDRKFVDYAKRQIKAYEDRIEK